MLKVYVFSGEAKAVEEGDNKKRDNKKHGGNNGGN